MAHQKLSAAQVTEMRAAAAYDLGCAIAYTKFASTIQNDALRNRMMEKLSQEHRFLLECYEVGAKTLTHPQAA